MTASEVLAAFAAKADPGQVPVEVAQRVPSLFLDVVGVALAGMEEPGVAAVRALAADSASAPQSTLFGFDVQLAVADAALANATAAHALDFDDVQHPLYGHPTAVLFPATFALAEQRHASGSRLVTAYLVGLAVGHALGSALNRAHYERGWHTTATFGTIATAAACANLLGLAELETTHALGIAASTSGGLRQNFGTDVKPLHAGLAARGGVQAAQLAERGLTSSHLALDGPLGFSEVFNRQALDPDQLSDALQDPFVAPLAGVGVKRYPTCGATHPAIDAALALAQSHSLKAEDVVSIRCVVSPLTIGILIYDRPMTSLEARFSLPYCIAAAIEDGRVELDQLEQDRLSDPALSSLMDRVVVVPDPTIDPAGNFAARVSVRLTSGEEVTKHVSEAKGKPADPLSREQVFAKFLGCASSRLTREIAAEVGTQLLEIDAEPDVANWARTLREASNR